MAAEIERLRSRNLRLRGSASARLMALTDEYELLSRELGREVPEAIRRDRAELGREAAAEAGWVFVMINAVQFNAVMTWLAKNSDRPIIAMRLWGLLFERLDQKTGEVMASRAELADLVGTRGNEVTTIMGQLEDLGAISRHRIPANGPVRYFVNPRVGSHLSQRARKLAQRDAPRLKLVEPTG